MGNSKVGLISIKVPSRISCVAVFIHLSRLFASSYIAQRTIDVCHTLPSPSLQKSQWIQENEFGALAVHLAELRATGKLAISNASLQLEEAALSRLELAMQESALDGARRRTFCKS